MTLYIAVIFIYSVILANTETQSEIALASGISKAERIVDFICIENRKHLVKKISFGKEKDHMNLWVSIMALNIKRINEIIYYSFPKMLVIAACFFSLQTILTSIPTILRTINWKT